MSAKRKQMFTTNLNHSCAIQLSKVLIFWNIGLYEGFLAVNSHPSSILSVDEFHDWYEKGHNPLIESKDKITEQSVATNTYKHINNIIQYSRA